MERKRRVKTGCLTCRRRRIKCDEAKPTCGRCKAANIECNGYQSPRNIDSPRHSRDSSNIVVEEEPRSLATTSSIAVQKAESPLVVCPCNPEGSQRPHQRAREILGHQQYSLRTAKLLFREDHLYFWRDYLLAVAWDTEYVFDVVVALGIIHRAVIMLSDPSDKWRGVDDKVVAFQLYANALQKLSEKCSGAAGQPSDKLIAVLLLLTYFECFVGNYIAAFKHLRGAQSHLDEANLSLLPHREPLVACISELGLVVQIILPLPLVNFPLVGALDPTASPRDLEISGGPSQELQQLLNLVCADRMVNVAIWSCLCNTEDRLGYDILIGFQSRLLRWKSQSVSTFRDYDESPSMLEPAESLATLPIPPKAQSFACMNAALAAAMFHCYMGRTMCMLSLATGGDDNYEKAAFLHAYHNLRIVQGIEKKDQKFSERQYFSCNAIKIGFIPLLFLGSQFCYNSTWLQFTIDKLMSIGQEGLYNGESFANALRSLGLFQAHAKTLRELRPVSEDAQSSNSAFSLRFNVVSILIPGPESKRAVAYYVQALNPNLHGTVRDRRKHVQIVGRARWERSGENTSTSVSMEFFDTNHPINQGLSERCLYLQIASNEPIAQEWEALLGTGALGRYGYFVHLAALRNSIMEGINSGLETATGLYES